MFTKSSTDQDLRKAQSHLKKGEVADACHLYHSVIQTFSKQGKALNESVYSTNKIINNNLIKKSLQDDVNELINLYNNNKFSIVVEKAQALTKQFPETFLYWNILGASAVQIGMSDLAVVALKKVISIKPNYSDAYNNISVAFKDQGKLDESIEACRKAISLNPNYATAYSNLGNALGEQCKFEEALEAYNKSISINPNYADAYYNMGSTLRDKGELDKAIDAYKKAISLKFDNFLVFNNMGLTLKDQGKIEEAILAFQKSISLNPNYAETHLNLGYVFLNDGKVREGLEEYEWRWKTKKGLSTQRHFRKPQWNGKINLKDKTILIWSEQGVGDNINWSAYLPFISSLAKHVILECPKKLVPLLSRSFPNVEVKAEDRSLDADRDDFDLHLPMGSLYKYFIDEIMENGMASSYLAPDPDRVKFWKDRLRSVGKGPYIGLSWKSSNMFSNRLQNYLLISDLYPILKMSNLTFINLQYKDYEDDIAQVQDELGITIHNFEDLDHFNDLLDVASLCSALDITITNKNSLSFISAGVGTSTKIANWKQSPWNNNLHNPVGPLVEKFERNTWETWENTVKSITNNIKKSNISG